MLSYKEYKQLNESLYGAFNLGIKQNNVITPPIGATGASELIETTPEEDSIEEAKKNKEEKGLTDAQKKLPKALQDAILKKKNMTEEEQVWWNSVTEMLANPNEKNWDGWTEIEEVKQAVRD